MTNNEVYAFLLDHASDEVRFRHKFALYMGVIDEQDERKFRRLVGKVELATAQHESFYQFLKSIGTWADLWFKFGWPVEKSPTLGQYEAAFNSMLEAFEVHQENGPAQQSLIVTDTQVAAEKSNVNPFMDAKIAANNAAKEVKNIKSSIKKLEEDNGFFVADTGIDFNKPLTDSEVRTLWSIPNEYTTEKFTANSWVQGSAAGPIVTYQTRGDYKKPVPPKEKEMTEDTFREYFESIAKEVPAIDPEVVYGGPFARPNEMLLLMLTDLHYGSINRNDRKDIVYSPEIVERKMWNLVQKELPKHVTSDTDVITLVLGNDMLHIDNTNLSTTAGTSMAGDTNGSYFEMFSNLVAFTHQLVEYVVNKYPNATILLPVICGNHDRNSAGMLYVALNAIYSKNGRVQVTFEEHSVQYLRYGASLIGLTHGDNMKNPDRLAGVMMSSRPRDYEETLTRIWVLGHEHRAGEKVLSEFGVNVRWSPSLCPPGVWAKSKGYINSQEAVEILKFNHEEGLVGILPIDTRRLG